MGEEGADGAQTGFREEPRPFFKEVRSEPGWVDTSRWCTTQVICSFSSTPTTAPAANQLTSLSLTLAL
jgi:hypothetical protein